MTSCLVVAAHPDDEVLGCGGAIAKFSSEGIAVHVALLADGVGARRNADLATDDPEHVARRTAARAAAKILGASSVTFGDFPDNRMDLVPTLDVARNIEALVERHTPEFVLTHHAGDLNVDHQAVHRAVLTACRPQPGHSVKTLLFFEIPSSTEWQPAGSGATFAPTWFIDISAQLGTRRRALETYASEMRAWPHARSYEAVEHLARWRGASVGVAAAEAFMLGRRIDRA